MIEGDVPQLTLYSRNDTPNCIFKKIGATTTILLDDSGKTAKAYTVDPFTEVTLKGLE